MADKMGTLEELVNASGISGFEGAVAGIVKDHLKSITHIQIDNLGSVVARKNGDSESPRIMVAGHMDEIGLMVSFITKEGFIKFQPIGGWWEQVMLAQRVVVKGKNGDIHGVIGSKPPHLLSAEERKKIVDMKDMFIDVGASGSEEVKEMGILPGSPVVPFAPFTRMKKDGLVMGKAMDDRVGCAVFIEVIKALRGVSHPNTVFGVGTVQEEVGLRGAKTSAEFVNPDIAFTAEISIAGDMPGVNEEEAQSKLGKGPAIVVLDGSLIPNSSLRDLVIDIAEESGIPYQFQAGTRGGTDGGRIHLNRIGVPTLVVGVPARYIHSHVSVIDYSDFEHSVRLLVETIKKLNKETVQRLHP